MKLYELSRGYQELQELIDEGDIPEDEIKDTLEAIDAELNVKADNIACLIKNFESEAEMIKNEAQKQLTRAESKLRKAKKLREYLKAQLITCNISKVETQRNNIQIKKNPPKLEVMDGFVVWARKNADDLLKYSTPIPDKTLIRDALQQGKLIPFVKLKSEQRIDIK